MGKMDGLTRSTRIEVWNGSIFNFIHKDKGLSSLRNCRKLQIIIVNVNNPHNLWEHFGGDALPVVDVLPSLISPSKFDDLE